MKEAKKNMKSQKKGKIRKVTYGQAMGMSLAARRISCSIDMETHISNAYFWENLQLS